MYMIGLFERSQAFYATDDEFRAASAEFAYCELLKSGVTSLIDISPAWEGWAELLARAGCAASWLRATPLRAGSWRTSSS